MISKYLQLNVTFLVVSIYMLLSYEIAAMPFNSGIYESYPSEGIEHLSRLRRGYYYVGDYGYVTRVANPALALERRDLAVRRFDDDNVAAKPVQKQKRKKLFVPNLYG